MQPGRRGGRNDFRNRSFFPNMSIEDDLNEDPFSRFQNMVGSSMFGPGMMESSMFGQGMFGPGMFPSIGGSGMFPGIGGSGMFPGIGGSGMFPDVGGSSIFQGFGGSSMFSPDTFGLRGLRQHPFGHPSDVGFHEQQPHQINQSTGPIITEITSDDEVEEDKIDVSDSQGEVSRKHSRSGKEPFIEHPDDQRTEEKKIRPMQSSNNKRNFTAVEAAQPQSNFYSYQSSSVTYGGHDRAYYKASTTRRTGSDGLTLEESKEADTTTGKASHRISRGHYDKGHSVLKNINSDGRVDTNEVLHNLHEDELSGFNNEWEVKARRHLPGYQGLDMLDNQSRRRSNGNRMRQNLSLPSTTEQHEFGKSGNRTSRGA